MIVFTLMDKTDLLETCMQRGEFNLVTRHAFASTYHREASIPLFRRGTVASCTRLSSTAQ